MFILVKNLATLPRLTPYALLAVADSTYLNFVITRGCSCFAFEHVLYKLVNFLANSTNMYMLKKCEHRATLFDIINSVFYIPKDELNINLYKNMSIADLSP